MTRPDAASGVPRGDAFSDLVVNANRPAAIRPIPTAALDRRSISEQVVDRILALIKSGNLKSGDRLPTEAQMTIALGISRPPLREALKALTVLGVLESRQGGRYTVTDLSPSRLVAPFQVMLSVGDYDVNEHFEARAVVDLELIRLFALNATAEQRQRVRTLAYDGRAFLHDPVAFRLLDIEYHQSLYAGGGNRLLSTLAQGLYDVGLDARRVASSLPGVIDLSVAQHIEVAEAILADKPDAAIGAYRRHLEHVRDTTILSQARLADGALLNPQEV